MVYGSKCDERYLGGMFHESKYNEGYLVPAMYKGCKHGGVYVSKECLWLEAYLVWYGDPPALFYQMS